MVGFGCSVQVSEVAVGEPPDPIGIELGVESLKEELAQNHNVEAALIGLLTLSPMDTVGLTLLSKLEQIDDPIAKETVMKARAIIARRK